MGEGGQGRWLNRLWVGEGGGGGNPMVLAGGDVIATNAQRQDSGVCHTYAAGVS